MNETIDPRTFRDTLGHYASGITIISGANGGVPTGFTCQSFYSVSTQPPLVSFSVMTTSTTYPEIRRSGRFAVNVLADNQREISNQFARKGTDKWQGIEWDPSPLGNPIIRDTAMWLDCTIWAEYEAGDHHIVIGEVANHSPVGWHKETPLLYFKGGYRGLSAADSELER